MLCNSTNFLTSNTTQVHDYELLNVLNMSRKQCIPPFVHPFFLFEGGTGLAGGWEGVWGRFFGGGEVLEKVLRGYGVV